MRDFIIQLLTQKSRRCFHCSRTGHSRNECPLKKGYGSSKEDVQKGEMILGKLPKPPKKRERAPLKRNVGKNCG